jgi:hypothetical protein
MVAYLLELQNLIEYRCGKAGLSVLIEGRMCDYCNIFTSRIRGELMKINNPERGI